MLRLVDQGGSDEGCVGSLDREGGWSVATPESGSTGPCNEVSRYVFGSTEAEEGRGGSVRAPDEADMPIFSAEIVESAKSICLQSSGTEALRAFPSRQD